MKSSLPSIDELSLLAAQLYSPEDGEKAVPKAVKLAGDIWFECEKFLRFDDEYHMEDFDFSQPLKVENHFMPRVSEEFLKKRTVKKDELILVVVGMSKKPDREKMFRAFVCDMIEFDSACLFSPSSDLLDGDPDPYHWDGRGEDSRPSPSVSDVMSWIRKYGVGSPREILESFRDWRLAKANPECKEREMPGVFGEALRKGLEQENRPENGTSPK